MGSADGCLSHLMDKPFSQSCDRNKEPILAVLQEVFIEPGLVLEIGSGSGQHAVYFAEHLSYMTWQPSDMAENLPAIYEWVKDAKLINTEAPIELDVKRRPWPVDRADQIFSANTAHIMSWHEVEFMFEGIGDILKTSGHFCLYGPFNYGGNYTSASNAKFDLWLREQVPNGGIRDFEKVNTLAEAAGMQLINDVAMPANNRTLVWKKII